MKGMVIRNEQNKTHREHERITAGSGGIRYPEDHGDLESDGLRVGTQAGFSGVPFGRLIRISREAFFEWMARNRIGEPIRKDEE